MIINVNTRICVTIGYKVYLNIAKTRIQLKQNIFFANRGHSFLVNTIFSNTKISRKLLTFKEGRTPEISFWD